MKSVDPAPQPTAESAPPPKMPKSVLDFLIGSGTALLAFYLLLVLVLSLGLIIAAWPYSQYTPQWLGPVSAELRYVILVACGGALGASLNAFRGLLEMIGNRTSVRGWLLWYALRVLVSIPLAMMAYGIIRGLLLSPTAENINLNPYGILIASVVTGMFSVQALEKMNSVVSSLFTPATEIEKQLDRIGTALGVATLDNYQGFVCVSLQDLQGNVVSSSQAGRPLLNVKQSYDLIAWFQPKKPEKSEGVLASEVLIEEGTDAKNIEFKLLPDSASVRLEPRQETINVPAKESSPRAKFRFQAPAVAEASNIDISQAPSQRVHDHDIWVEVFQKNRLIHVMSVVFEVTNSDKAS